MYVRWDKIANPCGAIMYGQSWFMFQELPSADVNMKPSHVLTSMFSVSTVLCNIKYNASVPIQQIDVIISEI